jgi:nucleoside-diphosphate-sugar epimerase
VLRDFIHVRDVAAIVLKICALQPTYSHINIGTGVATKISDVVKLVLSKFPALIIEPRTAKEVEYSRADTALLSQIWDGGFMKIEDFISEYLVLHGARPPS